MIVDKLDSNVNKKVANVSIQLINDDKSDTRYNITFELFEVVDKVLINLKITFRRTPKIEPVKRSS